MQALILFCASRCVMLSVLSPLIARIISPGHRSAMAALLPGLIYAGGGKKIGYLKEHLVLNKVQFLAMSNR